MFSSHICLRGPGGLLFPHPALGTPAQIPDILRAPLIFAKTYLQSKSVSPSSNARSTYWAPVIFWMMTLYLLTFRNIRWTMYSHLPPQTSPSTSARTNQICVSGHYHSTHINSLQVSCTLWPVWDITPAQHLPSALNQPHLQVYNSFISLRLSLQEQLFNWR